jgi:hypothetical protein
MERAELEAKLGEEGEAERSPTDLTMIGPVTKLAADVAKLVTLPLSVQMIFPRAKRRAQMMIALENPAVDQLSQIRKR